MEQRLRKLLLFKNAIYAVLLIICFVLQETPALWSIYAVRPNIVIAFITVLAMYEGEFSAAVYGLFGGLLCDMAAFHLYGVATLFFIFLGCFSGLAIIYLMQQNKRIAFLLTFGCALAYGLVTYFLIYGLWGYDNAAVLLLVRTLPSALYSAVFSLPLFWIFGKIDKIFTEIIEK